MIKVAYLINTISCDTSGTEKQLIATIRRLDRLKIEPFLICLRESEWMQQNEFPCPHIVLGYNGFIKLHFPFVIHRLYALIKEHQFHILQTFFEDSIFVAWLATSFGRQNLVLLSSRRDMGLGKGNQPWYHQLFGMALPFVNRSFDGIIANSQQVKEYVVKREKTHSEKIEVIYNGVEISEKSGNIPPVVREDKADVWITIVASLTPVKRHDVLIKAIAILCEKLDEQKIKVLVLGKGPEREKLVRLAEQENVQDLFHFEGAVHNVKEYLQHVDIGVLCSDREGLSNAVLEYMASGLPVVATAVGGNIELVNQDNGRHVPAGDPAALADALHELITDMKKRKQMGLMSRKRVEEYFSWQNSMQHLEEYYQTLIVEKGVVSDK